jgi:hypothetical protein
MKHSFLDKYGQKAADYLGLSTAGAIKVAPYSEDCHQEAFDSYISAEYRKKIAIKDPLKFYIYLCNDYCRSHFIDPDYPALTKLANQHNIDATTEVYLPPEQRVKMVIPTEDPKKKNPRTHRDGSYEGNPYRPVTHPWKKSVDEFPFSPRKPLDDIAEAIKFVGYVAAGIQAVEPSTIPTWDCFAKRAALVIDGLVARNEKYHLDLAAIIEQIDKFIAYTMEMHKDLPHIKKISSVEDATFNAHTAIAGFVPVLLKPFIEKGII